jgi:hypothetical protein
MELKKQQKLMRDKPLTFNHAVAWSLLAPQTLADVNAHHWNSLQSKLAKQRIRAEAPNLTFHWTLTCGAHPIEHLHDAVQLI